MIHPIILEASFLDDLFFVKLTVDEETHKEALSVLGFRRLCQGVDQLISVSGFTLVYGLYPKHDITVRCKRGIAQYFRSVLAEYDRIQRNSP